MEYFQITKLENSLIKKRNRDEDKRNRLLNEIIVENFLNLKNEIVSEHELFRTRIDMARDKTSRHNRLQRNLEHH